MKEEINEEINEEVNEKINGTFSEASEPLRIVHVLGRLDRGGAEAMVMNLYRRMDRNRLQFDFILHTQEDCAYSEEVRKLGGRIYAVPAFGAKTAAGYRRAWRMLLAAHPEWRILHSHVRSTASLYLPLAKKAGLTTIIHSHNTAAGKGLSGLVKALLQYPLRYQADWLFACSQMAGEWLYGKKACKSSRYHLLKNAIDTERFVFSPENRKQARAQLGISEDMFVAGHAGRFEKQKNHAFLLEIFSHIKRRGESTLLLAGDGPLEPDVRQQAKEMGLTHVRFLGSRPDMDRLLSVMDVFVFPSLFEGLPVTLIEAQAAGLAILASDTISREVVLTPLVKQYPLSESAEKWADAVCRLSREKSEEKRMQASRQAVQDIRAAGYDTAQTAKWLADFYESVAGHEVPEARQDGQSG